VLAKPYPARWLPEALGSTPIIAMMLATNLVQPSFSPTKAKANTTVRNGMAAWIVITSATGATLSALMKQIVAMVEGKVTRKPGRPVARTDSRRFERWPHDKGANER